MIAMSVSKNYVVGFNITGIYPGMFVAGEKWVYKNNMILCSYFKG
jgi:hypothetical protein